jgi:toxin ParE1/3/4
MSFEIEIAPLAKLEILDAYDWYELTRKGLGEEFLEELEIFFDQLLVNPKTHSYYQKPVRSGVLSRFPYSVTYEIAEKKVFIYSVFMSRQQPSKRRLK